jgi:hypothetical protein
MWGFIFYPVVENASVIILLRSAKSLLELWISFTKKAGYSPEPIFRSMIRLNNSLKKATGKYPRIKPG